MGDVAAIWIKRFHGGPMDRVESAVAVAGQGLVGNADQGRRRQITIIDESAWRAALDDLGIDVDPSRRRANVMLRGIDLEKTNGRTLRIGAILVRIFGETRPCHQMDEAQQGLRAALSPDWRAGAFAEVLEGGTIRVGDSAEWVEETARLF